MSRLAALLCGLLFGAGLVIGDMVNPARVLAFLDVLGDWDPSLAWVMVGALLPSTFAYRWVRRRQKPLFAGEFHLPTARDLDRPLLIGSALFGMGWGLAGVCPGPSIALLGTTSPYALAFFFAMVAGMLMHALLYRTLLKATP
ncbi:YeeE/YedE family protein [Stenotrophomonas geniculata]|uniref:YeeE/YedE family protein n=1 Tax=Stenotrophomonas geniculata TaxID=86188 RepID=UPI000F828445|nr:YeeE/YedE family protein [Stenotrophomonas geniculata]RTY19792.1 YeeE/YedE family protein [Stenotrophomonas geniculata]